MFEGTTAPGTTVPAGANVVGVGASCVPGAGATTGGGSPAYNGCAVPGISTRVCGGGTRSGVRNGLASGADWFLQPAVAAVTRKLMSKQTMHRTAASFLARVIFRSLSQAQRYAPRPQVGANDSEQPTGVQTDPPRR
jgi:hypothetical protein